MPAGTFKMIGLKNMLLVFYLVVNVLLRSLEGKSIILANYHNILLFFPKEYGGNDDLRVIFDVRNVTIGTFKYMPVVVDVAYDSVLNNCYCYMESAITSYIMLLKWQGGRWCYQVLFDFPASQFSKYMYHSILLMDNFIYWSTDRYIMSGRFPGYEKRFLLQPGWNRIYSMTLEKSKNRIYVAAYDYTENALFACNLYIFSCTKIAVTDFTINSIFFNDFHDTLFVTSIQGDYLYRYSESNNSLIPLNTVNDEIASIIMLADNIAVYTDQRTLFVTTDITQANSTTRKANAHLVDPYALQYVFAFNQIAEFDGYPYPYIYPDYHNLLYKNSLYLFYFYICAMDYVENDYVFLPQMDLNNHFLRVDNCQTRFIQEQQAYLIPSIVAGCTALLLIVIAIMICLWRSKACAPRVQRIRMAVRRLCWDCCCCCCYVDPAELGNDPKSRRIPFFAKFIKSQSSSDSSDDGAKKKSFTDSSGISSFPSLSISENVSKGDLKLQQGNVPPDSESYDNDPTNLNELDYRKYKRTSSRHSSASSNGSCKHSKIYSSGLFISNNGSRIISNFGRAQSSNNSFSFTSATSSTSSSPTRTRSQQSSPGGYSHSSSSTTPTPTLTENSSSNFSNTDHHSEASSKKPKFNDYRTQRRYYDYQYPSHSKIYNQNDPMNVCNSDEYLRSSPEVRKHHRRLANAVAKSFYHTRNKADNSFTLASNSTVTQASNNDSNVSTSPQKKGNVSLRRNTVYKLPSGNHLAHAVIDDAVCSSRTQNGDYISTLNMPIYTAANSKNCLSIIKALDFSTSSATSSSRESEASNAKI